MRKNCLYNPRYNTQTREELFLLGRRTRIMERLKHLSGKTEQDRSFQRIRLERRLRKIEEMLGCYKPKPTTV